MLTHITPLTRRVTEIYLKQTFQPRKFHARHASHQTAALKDRVAIVTGSTEGIGYAIAERLAGDGAKVVISSRKQANVDRAVQELVAKYPEQIVGTVCHVADEAHQDRLINFAMQSYGSLDILVSNVAVNPYFGSLIDMDSTAWDKTMEVNVKAPFQLTQKVVPHMLKNNRQGDNGSIVYISSIAGYGGMPAIGAYSISKTALLGLCKNMSMELGVEGIRVNLIAPGIIKTKFSGRLTDSPIEDDYNAKTHLKRVGQPQECSGIVSFLCSSQASYITGENIVVAGGYYCHM